MNTPTTRAGELPALSDSEYLLALANEADAQLLGFKVSNPKSKRLRAIAAALAGLPEQPKQPAGRTVTIAQGRNAGTFNLIAALGHAPQHSPSALERLDRLGDRLDLTDDEVVKRASAIHATENRDHLRTRLESLREWITSLTGEAPAVRSQAAILINDAIAALQRAPNGAASGAIIKPEHATPSNQLSGNSEYLDLIAGDERAEPKCAGDEGECAFHKACMYHCGRMEPPKTMSDAEYIATLEYEVRRLTALATQRSGDERLSTDQIEDVRTVNGQDV